jgi:SAM-dependent methyltransferase
MSNTPSYKRDLVAAYDADVERRNAMIPATWRTEIVDEFASDLATNGAKAVLELGCGTGQLAQYLGTLDLDVTAIDLSPGNVKAAMDRGVTAEVADFASLPFPDNTFDAALAVNSLLHVPPDELHEVLIEIARVLRRGATFMIIVWGGATREGTVEDEWLDPPRYFSSYTDDDLLALETPGFDHLTFEVLPSVEEGGDLYPQVLTLTAI